MHNLGHSHWLLKLKVQYVSPDVCRVSSLKSLHFNAEKIEFLVPKLLSSYQLDPYRSFISSHVYILSYPHGSISYRLKTM